MLEIHTVRGFFPFAAGLAGLLLAAFSPLTAAPRLVKDLDTGIARNRGLVSELGVAGGDVLYFSASDPPTASSSGGATARPAAPTG